MRISIFEEKFVRKKCALYMGKYSNSLPQAMQKLDV